MNCFDCANSRWCEVWGEVRCMKKERRIYKIATDEECTDFTKRTKGSITDVPCHCEDCENTRGSGGDV